jgi:hypothetical protein
MASMLSKPKMPDTSRQEAALAKQEAATAAQEQLSKQRDAAALNARKGRTAARTSLITGGNETGVQRTTLG